MRKCGLRILMVFLCVFLMLPAALADSVMKKGSRGEGVREAQEWLIDLGYLNDRADGIFGNKTEAAVKAFQKTIGVREDGRLTGEQADSLLFLWMDVTGAMEGDGLGEDELQEIYPAGCSRTGDRPGEADFCWRHFETANLNSRMRLPGLPDLSVQMLAERAVPQWEEAVRSLYGEWEKESGKTAREQLESFESGLKEKKAELENEYGTGSARMMQELAYWLEDVCIDLCFDLHAAESNGG